jgi:hypothetical protein
MPQEIIVSVLDRDEYLKNPIEVGLDKDWGEKSRNFDNRMRAQGVYILHTVNPSRIIYIGKARGKNLRGRIHDHCVKSADPHSQKVYQALKKAKETEGQIFASLITTEQIPSYFKGKNLKDAAMIDIYEQVLIHLLETKIKALSIQ